MNRPHLIFARKCNNIFEVGWQILYPLFCGSSHSVNVKGLLKLLSTFGEVIDKILSVTHSGIHGNAIAQRDGLPLSESKLESYFSTIVDITVHQIKSSCVEAAQFV